MKKMSILCFFSILSVSAQKILSEKKEITILLNAWHQAAGEAHFEPYMDFLTEDAVYLGTDATEYWDKKQFAAFARPYFDKGKAWSFTPLERHIYFSENHKLAWFDELLNTQMKICRGSGVLVLTKKGWKLKQYVLSMTIPNEKSNEITHIKSEIEDKTILNYKK